uniref:Secreted protein n=1 Tax=Steinernema glaseri TaxID=37863 RepID=A0A1I7ZSS6_9BILA
MGLPIKLLVLSLALNFAGTFQQRHLLRILNQPYLLVQQVREAPPKFQWDTLKEQDVSVHKRVDHR